MPQKTNIKPTSQQYLYAASITTGKMLLDLPVDRPSPAANQVQRPGESNRKSPQNQTQHLLQQMWLKLLNRTEIGIDDDFIQAGGNSLKAVSLVSRISRQLGVELRLDDIFKNSTIARLAEIIDSSPKTAGTGIPPAGQQDYYPLSSAQKRLFILQQMQPETIGYNMPQIIRLNTPPDPAKLTSTFKRLILRHQGLRTSFRLMEGDPVQEIHDQVPFEIREFTAGSRGDADIETIIQGLIRPFNLENAPLLRVGLISPPGDDSGNPYILMVDMHHIISDGVSHGIFWRDFTALYDNRDLPPLNRHYRDYAVWQQSRLESGAVAPQVEYWKKHLSSHLPQLNLPLDFPRPLMRSFAGSAVDFGLSKSDTAALRRMADDSGATLYMVLIAAYAVLMAKICNQEDIVIGTPTAGRTHADLEPIVGMFVNTLVLTMEPRYESTFTDFLETVKTGTMDAFENQDCQFEDLVELLVNERDTSRNPLFDVCFAMQDVDMGTGDHDAVLSNSLIATLAPEPYIFENNTAKFDLRLNASSSGESATFSLEYATTLFKRETVKRFCRYFQSIVSRVTQSPQIKIAHISLIDDAEKKQLLMDFNDTRADYPRDRTLHCLFAEQAAKTPDRIALKGHLLSSISSIQPGVVENSTPISPVYITYRELDQQTDRLAQYIRQHCSGMPPVIIIMVQRSVEMMIGILAVLKSGAAYLPIAPDTPDQRKKYLLKDSAADIILTSRNTAGTSRNWATTEHQIISLDDTDIYTDIYINGDGNQVPAAVSTDPAYVIYTSGSTGKPKGVIIEHRAAVNRIHWMQRFYPIHHRDVILQKTTFTFDVSVWELFWWFFNGASVYLPGPGTEKDPEALVSAIEIHNISTMHFVPSMLTGFLHYLEANTGNVLNNHISLRQVFASGEALGISQVETFNRLLFAPHGTRLINLYGPTEAAVDVTYYNCPTSGPVEGTSIPIGRPIDNIRLYIIDKTGALQPLGVAGELCISGDGLARGYLNRPELTAQRFIPDIFYQSHPSYPSHLSHRSYKTGDLARRLPDGNIEFMGRIDHQVKIRGFRIEPGEIESLLAELPNIKEAVVIPRQDPNREKSLCAYIVPRNGTIDITATRETLAAKLPEYMVPAYFVQLNALPITPNGKLDRKALPAPQVISQTQQAPPRTPTEKTIAAIWQELLQLEQVGIRDNFFHLGGNSLQVIKAATKLSRDFGKKIPVALLFRFVTIETLARYLDDGEPSKKQIRQTPDDIRQTGPEIAVIGMAGRFPGAGTIPQFHRNLINGVESIAFFSREELEQSGIDAQLLDNPHYIPAKGYVEGREYFDASFFGYIPAEARIMDPQIRVFHEVAWEALEDAGYDPRVYEGIIGLYAGASPNFYWEAYATIGLGSGAGAIDPFSAAQLRDKDYLSTRVAYALDLKGPAVNVQSACSTSLTAVDNACRSLMTGSCHMALAGGITLPFSGKIGYLYRDGMIESADGHCRAFDAQASGTVNGEGAALVVLKPLERAIADHDHIYAVIKGTGINNDGTIKAGYTAPSVEGQAAAIRSALHMAGVGPETITYIEAHGTGTLLGDPVEIEALKLAFDTHQKQFCAIGSVKTNIGHLDAAAGAAGLIKTSLALKYKLIPPSLHYTAPNPKIDLGDSPFYVAHKLTPWENQTHPRRAGVSSFGMGGTNVHVILEEAPPRAHCDHESKIDREIVPLLVLSARSETALNRASANLSQWLTDNPGAHPLDVAYTLQKGRHHFKYRRALVWTDRDDVMAKLSHPPEGNNEYAVVSTYDPPVVFMFSGQGSQYVNMGRDLYRHEPRFRQEMDRCLSILETITGTDLKPVIYPPGDETETTINHTGMTQPLIFAFEYSLARLLISRGICPTLMIGHSIGEYTAACIAGVFSLEDALKLVSARGRLMQQLPGGDMLSVPLSETELTPLLTGETGISLAAVNTTNRSVVSGTPDAVKNFEMLLTAKGKQSRRLHTSHAFHSAMMDPMLQEFRKVVETVSVNPPTIPFISNVTGKPVTIQQLDDPGYWTSHIRCTVRFADGLQQILTQQETALLVEVGPGKALTTFANQHGARKPGHIAVNLVKHPQEDAADHIYLVSKIGKLWLNGVKLDWEAFYENEDVKPYRVSLPTYPFERRYFWLDNISLPGGLQLKMPESPVSVSPESPLPMEGTPDVGGIRYRNPTEAAVAYIWQDFFGISRVGRCDDFFDLGGDSLKAMNIISLLNRQFKVEIPLPEFFKSPTVEGIAVFIDRVAGEAGSVDSAVKTGSLTAGIEPVEKREYYPVSSAQKRLYILSEAGGISTAYNMPQVLDIEGKPNIDKLERAFSQLIQRHESLRTSFHLKEGQPVQRIHPFNPALANKRFFGGSKGAAFSKKAPLAAGGKNIFIRPFDLSEAPLLRVELEAIAPKKYQLRFDMHHIISDGMSMSVLVQDLVAFYTGQSLEPLPLQYKDYSQWQDRLFRSGAFRKQEQYWLEEQFADPVPLLTMPLDYKRPLRRTFDGSLAVRYISDDRAGQLNEFVREHNITLNILFFTVYALLIRLYSGQDDIVIGSLTAGRHSPQLEPIIGLFINFLPVRIRAESGSTFRETMESVKNTLLNAYENQDYPFETIIEKLELLVPPSRNPLFDTMLVFHNEAESAPSFAIDDFKFVDSDSPVHTATLDFKLDVRIPPGGDIGLAMEYNINLFSETTIVEFLCHFEELLFQVAESPHKSIREFHIFSTSEESQLPARRALQSTDPLTPLSLAVSATFTSEPFAEYARWFAKRLGQEIDITFAPYNQVFQQLLDPGSLLFTNAANGGINLLLLRFEDWIREIDHGETDSVKMDQIRRNYHQLVQILEGIASKPTDGIAAVYLTTLFPVSTHCGFSSALVADIEALTEDFVRRFQGNRIVYILDCRTLADHYSVENIFDPVADREGHVPFTDPYFAVFGTAVARDVLRLSHSPVNLDTHPLIVSPPAVEQLMQWVREMPLDNLSLDKPVVYEPPGNETERKLQELWEERLHLQDIGIHHDYFALGGNSLRAVAMVSAIHKAFNVQLRLKDIFDNPTIKKLARLIDMSGESIYTSIRPVEVRDHYPLSAAQRRMYILSEMQGIGTAYNMPGLMTIEGKLDVSKFEKAILGLIQRHESLRTSFHIVEGHPVQRIHPSEPELFNKSFFRGSKGAAFSKKAPLAAGGRKSFIRPFDLSTAPLFRVSLNEVEKEKYQLMFDMHHIVSDGVSMGILVQEFIRLYRGETLEPLRIQYKDFALWQNRLFTSQEFQDQEEYWMQQYRNIIPVLNMPLDFPRPDTRTFEGKTISHTLTSETAEGLNRLARERKVTLNILFFAVYVLLLSKYSNQRDIVVGSLTAGRNHPDLENLMGMFGNFLPIRIHVPLESNFTDYLEQTRQFLLDAYQNQDYPFDRLVEHLKLHTAGHPGRNPLFDTMLVFQNQAESIIGSQPVASGIDGLTFTVDSFEDTSAALDFKLDVFSLPVADNAKGGSLYLELQYNTRLFLEESMQRLIRDFEALLEQLTGNPTVVLDDIEVFTVSEETELSRKRALDPVTHIRPMRMVVAATFTAEPVEDHLKWWGKQCGFITDVVFAPYNQVFQQLLDPSSLLSANGGINLLAVRLEDWIREEPDSASHEEKCQNIQRNVQQLTHILKAGKTHVPYLVSIFPVSTHLDLSPEISAFIRNLTRQWQEDLTAIPHVHIIDFEELAQYYLVDDIFNPLTDREGHVPFTDAYYAAWGAFVMRKIAFLVLDETEFPSHVFTSEPMDSSELLTLPVRENQNGVLQRKPYAAPRDELETTLATIWESMLGIKRIGLDDDYFRLGGNSLNAVILVSRVHAAFNVELRLNDIFSHSTLRAFARHIRESGETAFTSIPAVEDSDYYPISPAQAALNLLPQDSPDRRGVNPPLVLELKGDVDSSLLESIFQQMIRRHESLRTSFHIIDSRPVQKIHPEETVLFTVDYRDFSTCTNRADDCKPPLNIDGIIQAFLTPFDLSRPPLVQCGLATLEHRRHLFILDIHPLIDDGTSSRIFVNEFIALSAGVLLPPLSLRYRDYSQWQYSPSKMEDLARQEAYWLKQFPGEPPVLQLPTDFPRPPIGDTHGGSIDFFLEKKETKRLKELLLSLNRTSNVTVYMVLLTIFYILLGKLGNQEDIVVGTPVACRPHVDLQGIIGRFANTLALRNYPSCDKTFRQFLTEVGERTLAAFENQEYRLRDLVDKLGIRDRDTTRNPLMDVYFTLQNIAVQPIGNVDSYSTTVDHEEASFPMEITPIDFGKIRAEYDLVLSASEYEEGEVLRFNLLYRTSLFKRETVEGFTEGFKNIVTAVLDNPEIKISEIN